MKKGRRKFKCLECGFIVDIAYHTKRRKREERKKNCLLSAELTYPCPRCGCPEWLLFWKDSAEK